MKLTINNKEKNPLRKLLISDFRINEIINAANELINQKRIINVNIDFAELVNELQIVLLKKNGNGLNDNELYFISFIFGLFSYDIKVDIIHFAVCDDPFLCFCIRANIIDLKVQFHN